jgi:Na+/H+ antiporter NhaD/arsenite permease-like protein
MLLWSTWIGAFFIGNSPIATLFAPLASEIATIMGWPIGVRDPLFWGAGLGTALGGITSPFGSAPLLVLAMVSFKDSKMSWSRFLSMGTLVNLMQIGLCSLYIMLFALPL